MARPEVADGGEGLQIWRVAVNIMNTQSWTVHKGWSSSLKVGLTTLHCKNLACYEMSRSTLDLD
jgi:hypothetical protein